MIRGITLEIRGRVAVDIRVNGLHSLDSKLLTNRRVAHILYAAVFGVFTHLFRQGSFFIEMNFFVLNF